MNRGSVSVVPVLALRGRGFNEAPIHESGKCQRRRVHGGLQLVASMRPRFMNRGSYGRAPGGAVAVPASMRPRFMNRGSD